jgi:hypothetical protein
MPDDTGVTTWTATRLQMIRALQQIPVQDPAPQPAPRRRSRLRKAPAAVPHKVTCPLDVPGVADLILAHLPEAGAVPEISEAEFEAAKADVIARFGAVPLSLQRVADRGGRFGLPVITAMADSAVTLSLGDLAAKDAEIEDLTGRAERAEAKLSHAIGALQWFAAPGAMSATARRQRASEVLSFLDAAAAGEAVAADEPA